MTVLVCNTDHSAARIVRRMLTQSMGHNVVEVANGLEVLKALEHQSVDGLVLDALMPVIGSLEVIRIIRDSPTHAALPVVVLTTEADDTVVKPLIALGVRDIVLQTVNADKLAARLEPALQHLVAVGKRADLQGERRLASRLTHESLVLLVDGDADYRQYFRKVVSGRFRIAEAGSGVEALEAFHKPLPDAVLLGANLGIVGAERIVQRLRAAPGRSVLVVAVPPKSEAAAVRASGLYDDVIARTYIPAALEKELGRLVQAASAFGLLTQAVPDIKTRILRAAEQVFGVMLLTDVEPTSDTLEFEGSLPCGVIDIATPTFVLGIRILLDFPSARRLAAAFLESSADDLGDEDVVSVVGEVANVLTGRLKAAFEERNLEATIGLPALSTVTAESCTGDGEHASSDLSVSFRAIDRSVMFRLDFNASKPSQGLPAVDSDTGVLALRTDGNA